MQTSLLSLDPDADFVENFTREGDELVHTLRCGKLRLESRIENTRPASPHSDFKSLWWKAYLEGENPRSPGEPSAKLRAVDLFCGIGGLARGVAQLLAEMGGGLIAELICDLDPEAVGVYSANHSTRMRSTRSVTSLIDFRVEGWGDRASFPYEPEIIDPRIAASPGHIDLVMAGPPCQGHSNLNNHTRRTDKRNELYMTVPAFAVATSARMAIIENVPAVVRDRSQVVETARSLFESAGYRVEYGVLAAAEMGWPQTRRRFFMVAHRRVNPIPLATVADLLAEPTPRSVLWAIGELEDTTGDDLMHSASELSDVNRSRINWLFDNQDYDLPSPERPPSHRDGTSYKSVYGRMRGDSPAPTLTTGFLSPGRGRYVHPTRRRTLTLREGARIQGFPDTYRFITDPTIPPSRTKVAQWIGNAVPMPLGYAAALAVLAVDPSR